MIKHFCDKCNKEIDKNNMFEDREFKVAEHPVKLCWSGAISKEAAICKGCVFNTLIDILGIEQESKDK